jgi:hypothetical protein
LTTHGFAYWEEAELRKPQHLHPKNSQPRAFWELGLGLVPDTRFSVRQQCYHTDKVFLRLSLTKAPTASTQTRWSPWLSFLYPPFYCQAGFSRPIYGLVACHPWLLPTSSLMLLSSYPGLPSYVSYTKSQAWWYMPVIPVLGRPRQKDHQMEASLPYSPTQRDSVLNTHTHTHPTASIGQSWVSQTKLRMSAWLWCSRSPSSIFRAGPGYLMSPPF